MLTPIPPTQLDSTFGKGRREQGSVLLSSDGRIMKLNSVGTIIWEILYSNVKAPGLSEAECLTLFTDRVERLFPTDIAREAALNDLKQFLFVLTERRLISVTTDRT